LIAGAPDLRKRTAAVGIGNGAILSAVQIATVHINTASGHLSTDKGD
jgi:hypothetical protein